MDVVLDAKGDFTFLSENPLPCYGDFYTHALLALGYSIDNLPLCSLISSFYSDTHLSWLCTPVIWEASHNDARIIFAGDNLPVSENVLIDAFNETAHFFEHDNILMKRHSPTYWLMDVPDTLPRNFAPNVMSMLYQSMMMTLQTLDAKHFWSLRLTEIQMLFEQNRASLQSVNGVWIWQDKSCHHALKRRVISDDEQLLFWIKKQGGEGIAFSPELSFYEKDILILRDVTHLETIMKKTSPFKTRWYWLDSVHDTPGLSFWNRLWRRCRGN